MQILNRYIRSNVIAATALVVGVLAAIDSFMVFFAQTSDIGKANYTMFKAILFVLMQLPLDMYQYFPMAGFLGCLIGLGRLASTSELVVMRSSGISVVEITYSVIKAALIMLVVMTLIGEVVAPMLQSKSEQMKAYALGKEKNYSTLGWLRDKNQFIHIGKIVSPTKVNNVTVFNIVDHKMQSNSYSGTAIRLKNGAWQMQNVVQSHLGGNKITSTTRPTLDLKIKFDPVNLVLGQKSVQQLSVVGLYKTIKYRAQAGLEIRQFQYTFWQRIFQPLVTIIMICLGVPFIFGSLRNSSMGLRVLTGIIIGFSFYTLNQVIGPLSVVYQIPLIIGAIIPLVISLCACVILFRRL